MRAEHVVRDIERVHECVVLLKQSDFSAVGQILTQSHASLRDLFEISCPELNLAVDTALANNSLGGRMIGGGFGGSAIALFKVADIPAVKIAIAKAFSSAGFTKPRFFTSLPSNGAKITQEHATYKGEGIKQADVNLLAFPLKSITDKAQVKRDLDYYSVRVPNQGTPAMTQAIFALLYARLGETENAYHFFKDAYQLNLNPPFRVIAETKGGTNPYFGTGAGGILQSMLMGFGGLDITENGIVQLPTKLPAKWKKLEITGVLGKNYVAQ